MGAKTLLAGVFVFDLENVPVRTLDANSHGRPPFPQTHREEVYPAAAAPRSLGVQTNSACMSGIDFRAGKASRRPDVARYTPPTAVCLDSISDVLCPAVPAVALLDRIANHDRMEPLQTPISPAPATRR